MNMIKYTVYAAFILQLFLGSAICLAESASTVKPEETERVTLNFRKMPIQEVFDILARKEMVNIILDKAVTGQVTVNLHDISVRDAIYRVAEAAGYAVELRNSDYFILDRKDVGMEHPSGLMQLRTFKVQYSDPRQVAEILTKYLSRYGKITPLNDRRMIVIEDTPEFLERFSKLLQEVDAQPKQILIEARVLEITLDEGETYGVDWSQIFGSAPGANGVFGTNGLATGSVAAPAPGFFYNLTNKKLNVFLEAKATKNRVRTLSSPKLLAMENKEATAQVGNNIGYKMTTTINQVSTESVQFLETGVILRVTPSVDQLGRVLLKVHPEVSSATTNASTGAPDKKSTQVTTELLCEDGEAVFIGGLIKKNSSNEIVGVPLLSSIPFLGHLFSRTVETVNNTETVVIITPRIVQNQRVTDEAAMEKIRQIEQDPSLTLNDQIKPIPTDKKDIPVTE